MRDDPSTEARIRDRQRELRGEKDPLLCLSWGDLLWLLAGILLGWFFPLAFLLG